jgi:hypothetical protein
MSCDRQVVEVDRRLFQFKVNYPQDFDEITMRDFWHVQGRMELLDALQDGAKSEEEAIKEFYDYYTEVRPASVCRKALLLSGLWLTRPVCLASGPGVLQVPQVLPDHGQPCHGPGVPQPLDCHEAA